MSWKQLLFILSATLLLNISSAKSLRVLGIFPHPGISHFHFFHPLMRGLAQAGHDVTVVSYFPNKNPVVNYTDIQLTGLPTLTELFDIKLFDKGYTYTHFNEFLLIHDIGLKSCEALLNSKALSQILSPSKQYDVVIVEQFNSDCVTGVSHFIKAPIIGVSSSAIMPWHYKRMGSPGIPSYVPVIFLGHSEQMGFLSRIKNFLSFHAINFLYRYMTQRQTNQLLKKRFGDSVPDVQDIESDYSVLFVNQHYSLSGAKPLSPAVIELGGLHIQEPKPLDPNIKQILDSAEHGVIYISWGSLLRTDSLPVEKREAILRAVSRLDQKVLWKWENETLPNQPKNVFIRKWMPQRDILCHPNVKIFMTHGGLLGSSEAAYCGVPAVVTPILGDQFLNAAALEYRGMGIILPFDEITEDSVYNAIKEALDSRISKNAKIVSASYRDRPEKPLDTAIWWVEHVVETKESPLTRSVLTHMPWYIEYSLDVYTFLGVILAAVYICFKFMFRIMCGRSKVVKKTKTS